MANTSKLTKSIGTPQSAKKTLRQELEKLKPKILLKIEAATTNYANDISG